MIQYNNKEGVSKEVWYEIGCVYLWILCGPASGGQAPLYGPLLISWLIFKSSNPTNAPVHLHSTIPSFMVISFQ